MKLASINVGPRKEDGLSGGGTVFIFQDGRCLEDYVEEFIDTCHQAICSDLTLMEGFRVGLDEEMQIVMPLGDPSWSLAQYLTFALWIAGSSYQVGEMEATPAPESSPNTTAAPQSNQPSIPSADSQISRSSTIIFSPETLSSAKSSLPAHWHYPQSSLHLSSPQSLPRLHWSRPAPQLN
ncbi:hypothetical protein G5714_000968 [Onychostoma macrolepis]|uniref:Uncharacterized protein n=1 Tax=Onychostoma macrolepis TaxID=369639 RepID=A0A7J6DHY9_9TELE|nr:hypothetical protein G5714_000968 [Onychostoma macrolepis]